MGILNNEQLAARIQRGERNLVSDLYENCRGFICQTAAGFSGCHRKITPEDPASTPQELLYEDLRQQALFALIRAVDGWKPDEGRTFLVYFASALKSEFWRYMADCGYTIRIPQSYRSALRKYEKAVYRFRTERGTDPTPEDLARILGVSADQAEQLRDDCRLLSCGSLDAPAGEDGEDTVLDLQPCEVDPIGETVEQIQRDELEAALWPLIDTLPGKHQAEVLRLRFKEGKTYEEIAAELAVSRAMAAKCIKQAVKKLRSAEYAERLKPYTDEAAEILGYRNTGLGAFQRTGSSSVEIAALHLNEYRAMMEQYHKQRHIETI